MRPTHGGWYGQVSIRSRSPPPARLEVQRISRPRRSRASVERNSRSGRRSTPRWWPSRPSMPPRDPVGATPCAGVQAGSSSRRLVIHPSDDGLGPLPPLIWARPRCADPWPPRVDPSRRPTPPLASLPERWAANDADFAHPSPTVAWPRTTSTATSRLARWLTQYVPVGAPMAETTVLAPTSRGATGRHNRTPVRVGTLCTTRARAVDKPPTPVDSRPDRGQRAHLVSTKPRNHHTSVATNE